MDVGVARRHADLCQHLRIGGCLYRLALPASRLALYFRLAESDTRLFAVFKIGATLKETRVFQWAVESSGALRYLDDRGERVDEPL